MPELRFTDAELDRLADVLAERVAARLEPAQRTPLMTVNDAARALGCHPKTVRRRIESGVLSAVREQGRVLLRAEDVDAYVGGLGRADDSPPPARRRRSRARDLGLDFLREQ